MLNIFKKTKDKKTVNRAQKRLDEYKPAPEKNLPQWALSLREVEEEADKNLRTLQLRIRDIKETSLKIDELTKMFKAGEISENTYKILLSELSACLSLSIEEILKTRENLELLRARAKLEWAKEKIETERITTEYLSREYAREIYYNLPVFRWQEILSRIDSALSSLSFEEELSIIERYLSITRERDLSEKLNEMKLIKQICQQRLNILSEKWFSIRRDKIKKIMDLEARASQLRDDIKEVEVRFAVGEFNRNLYDLKMGELQGALRNLEKEITGLRDYINEIDQRIFRITELLKEE
ncbi:MAG: hypothetical protein QW341_03020 [Candidatus Bathyarchaeia archaeon]